MEEDGILQVASKGIWSGYRYNATARYINNSLDHVENTNTRTHRKLYLLEKPGALMNNSKNNHTSHHPLNPTCMLPLLYSSWT